MKEEMEPLVENDTWEFVDCPNKVKVIDNRWVLRTTVNADSLTKRLRARLVAKGHVQKAGIYYNEIFSSVSPYDEVCAVLAVAALERVQLSQLDVKTAFIYGKR